jgi:DNA gyrase inhibitor GyrI
MALQAKFMKMGKGGALAIYEVRGTSAEVSDFVKNNYKDREPAFKSAPDGKPILDSNGNKVALYFTSYPLPGKNTWHPM